MKKISIIFSIVVLMFANISYCSDINNHWAYKDFERMINNEYITGYENGIYKPDEYITKSEFIKILVKTINDELYGSGAMWYVPYIDYAINIGLIDNDNNCGKYINRQQVFNCIYNYLSYTIEKKEENNSNPIDYLLEQDLIKGYQDKTLKLENYITRAECISLINRVINFKNEKNYLYEYNIDIFDSKDIFNYTNYDTKQNEIFLNKYKIINGNVIYSDYGRLDNYINERINNYNAEIIQIVLKLLGKENYVLNTYIKQDKSTIIAYGEKAKYIDNGNSLFDVLIYQEKQQLGNNNQYNVKINIYKLWKEINEIKNNQKYNNHYVKKLKNVLQTFLSEKEIDDILNIIQQKEIQQYPQKEYLVKKENQIYTIYINR